MTVKPRVKVAIQYDPKHRGVYLALAYCRIRRGSEAFFDLYGTCVGYCGGGAYADFCFHVGEQVGIGFISYTPSYNNRSWHDDRIGISGLAGQVFADDVDALVSYVQGSLWTRWCCRDDDGNPELWPAAKRRLKCERREVFYTSAGFNRDLLAFLSPVWGISVQFGEVAEDWDRFHQDILRWKRDRRIAFITVIIKYPQLIEGGLRLLHNEAFGRCGRAKLVFADNQGSELVATCQLETVTERDVERIATLNLDLNSSEHERARLIVVAETIEPAIRQLLDRDGISWREIPQDELCRFLDENGDANLSEFISAKKGLNPPPSYPLGH